METGRHELTDEQYARLEPLLPVNGRRGGQWDAHRPLVNGMMWRLRAGCPWRDVPARYGPWQTVYERFNRWSGDGTLLSIAEALLTDLDEAGGVDWDLWNIDGSVVRAHRAAAGAAAKSSAKAGRVAREPPDHALGRSQGGFGTKLHLICDGNGVPLIAELTPGQSHESTRCEPLVQSLLEARPGAKPKSLAGDKGYTGRRIREWLKARLIEPVIARQKSERVPGDEADFDKETYRRRNVIERCIGWLKECRAVATRYEKLAVNFPGSLCLATIMRYLRLLNSPDTA